MRSQGFTWVDDRMFYFRLKCGYCGKRLRGKKQSAEPYVIDWQGWGEMQVKPVGTRRTRVQKKYMTAKRKKK